MQISRSSKERDNCVKCNMHRDESIATAARGWTLLRSRCASRYSRLLGTSCLPSDPLQRGWFGHKSQNPLLLWPCEGQTPCEWGSSSVHVSLVWGITTTARQQLASAEALLLPEGWSSLPERSGNPPGIPLLLSVAAALQEEHPNANRLTQTASAHGPGSGGSEPQLGCAERP